MSGTGLIRLTITGFVIAAVGITTARAEVLIGVVEMQTGGTATSLMDQLHQSAVLAVAEINATGGVLGQKVRMIVGDDACDGEQGVALANKFVSDGVVFVAGHPCSDASIPASLIYAAARVVMISPG
jgi:branched-chain amino acid transport system substrate-binding protein